MTSYLIFGSLGVVLHYAVRRFLPPELQGVAGLIVSTLVGLSIGFVF